MRWPPSIKFKKENAIARGNMKTPATSSHPPISSHPLCVDLDGTLINTDLLMESLLLLIKRNPLYIFCLPFWLLQGRAALKENIAQRVSLKPALLPYNRKFLDWIKQEKESGRSVWLCTGSYQRLAEEVAKHLDIFDGVVATTKAENFTGKTKAQGLVNRFGAQGFAYCGNEKKDIPVWQVSHEAVVVNASKSLEESVRKIVPVNIVFPHEGKSRTRPLLKALRLPQWAKNILVFVPLITAHHMTDIESLEKTTLAFLSFCFCASAVYLLNDMLDLEADRQHPTKSARPFASGKLPLAAGFILMPVLLIASFLLAMSLPPEFLLTLAGYYLLTTLYSFYLKRLPLVDTLCLACLYTLRIIAGAAATGIPPSFWLLLFSMFFFLSLAWVKRCAELDEIVRNQKGSAAGRGYTVEDLLLVKMFGITAGYLSVLVLALYINSPGVAELYRHPQIIWLLCPLILFWIGRIWLKTHHGKMHHDPVIFALKDKTSFITGLLALLALMAAV